MNDSQSTLRVARLPHMGVIYFEGPDSATFLQGQLTTDVQLLEDGRTQLAALNTPQGRVIALLRLKRTARGILALLPNELSQIVIERLQRYVLRAKVRITLEPGLLVSGVFGSPGRLPEPPMQDHGAGSGSELEDLVIQWSPERSVIVSGDDAWQSWPSLAGAEKFDDASREWMLADIAAGLPQVFAETSEAYVAQMLNLDLIDAISFDKGCYTGQEIITRTQHLGRIKRRSLRYRVEQGPAPEPRTPLYRGDTKVGEVAMSAFAGEGADVLAVTTLEAAENSLRLADGRIARAMPLPYEVSGAA